MVKNKPEYWEFIRQLRNDDIMRANSLNSHIIEPEEHHAYMSLHNDKYYICLDEDVPVGYVARNAQDYISVAVISQARGKGIGKYMLQYFGDLMRTQKLRAVVSLTNPASLKLFESCGFVKKYYVFERDQND